MGWKRLLLRIATVAVLFGLGYVVWPRKPIAIVVAEPLSPLQQIESDLQLRAELKTDKLLVAGNDPYIVVSLFNSSNTVTHRVVKPGLGSEIAYREPHIYWTATIDRGDGKPVPVPERQQYGYCGLGLASSSYWPKDAISFAPGEHLDIDIPQQFEFQQAGRVRLQVHYEYLGGKVRAWDPKSDALAFLAGVPPFHLRSAEVEFDVVRPLDVRVKVKKAMKINRETRLSDLLSIRLINSSNEAIACASPENGRVRFRLEVKDNAWPVQPVPTETPASKWKHTTIEPGAEVSLIGPGEFDGTWTYPRTGRLQLRAIYMQNTDMGFTCLMSDWVDVQVEE